METQENKPAEKTAMKKLHLNTNFLSLTKSKMDKLVLTFHRRNIKFASPVRLKALVNSKNTLLDEKIKQLFTRKIKIF